MNRIRRVVPTLEFFQHHPSEMGHRCVLVTPHPMAAAAAFGRVLRSFLFGVTVHDPITYALVPVALTFAAVIGLWLPARHAARVDPIVALRTN